uniref:interleukin 4 receptor, tandem duplicate 2 precursor n=1 Tax=Danio rerio TaxID=7955 RepID=UPI0000545A4B|nr:IL-4RA-like protein 2 soluble form [Danio rerio]AEZ49866.1 soluble IL-4 receptor alpha isotype [Danio rerio]
MSSSLFLYQIILTLVCQALCDDPIKDLNCFNDYEAEMTCSFSSESLRNCSGYKLNVTQKLAYEINRFSCVFERSHHNAICECKIEVEGFITEEIFSTTLLKGTKVLLQRDFKTIDYIKPKTPVLFVKKTENRNFHVTWDDSYGQRNVFTDNLFITLTYRIKGEIETNSTKEANTVGFCVIVGSLLQPKTEYILTAKMSSNYNGQKIYSDQSAAVHFTTGL